MRFNDTKKALCLSPHPDDVEYSMSGVILKYVDTTFDILCLTKGGGHDTTTSKNRIKENVEFWTGVPNIEYSHNENISIEVDTEGYIISEIEKFYDMDKYDTIFIPASKDTHFAHRIVNKVGKSLGRVSQKNIYEYYTPSTENEWEPNMGVDISGVYTDKKSRLKNFKSQLKHSYFNDFSIDSFHTDLFFSKKGLRWIEKFKIICKINK